MPIWQSIIRPQAAYCVHESDEIAIDCRVLRKYIQVRHAIPHCAAVFFHHMLDVL